MGRSATASSQAGERFRPWQRRCRDGRGGADRPAAGSWQLAARRLAARRDDRGRSRARRGCCCCLLPAVCGLRSASEPRRRLVGSAPRRWQSRAGAHSRRLAAAAAGAQHWHHRARTRPLAHSPTRAKSNAPACCASASCTTHAPPCNRHCPSRAVGQPRPTHPRNDHGDARDAFRLASISFPGRNLLFRNSDYDVSHMQLRNLTDDRLMIRADPLPMSAPRRLQALRGSSPAPPIPAQDAPP